jgi:hypothetical protein
VSDREFEYTALPLYRDGLSSALGFDPSDLGPNRVGQLGTGERRTQMRQLVITSTGTLVVLALAIVFVIVGFAFGPSARYGFQALLAAAACLFGAGYFGWYGIRLWLDIRAGVVSSIEGFVKPTERATRIGSGLRGATAWTYYWNVDSRERFAVPGKAYGALTPARHRLYYLPRTRRVIAAEPVD